jgi:acyl-CoA thioesterase
MRHTETTKGKGTWIKKKNTRAGNQINIDKATLSYMGDMRVIKSLRQ